MQIIVRPRLTFRNDPELLHLFFIAETLGKTVDELLTGKPKPISNVEVDYWYAYRVIKKEIEDEQVSKSSSNESNRLDNMPPHMGMGQ